MTTEAFIMMIAVQLGVTLVTLYFFIKVIKAPKKDADSYINDDED